MRSFIVTFVALAVAAFMLATSAPCFATRPPHGHQVLKGDDPRLKPNHTLAEPIEHVFDVKAEYLGKYMRPVKGVDNRMTLLVIYASWCEEVCNEWVPVLKEIALLTREAQIRHRLTIIKHDVTQDDVMVHKLKLEGLPAIGLVEAAHHTQWDFKRYTGKPDADEVISFIEMNSPDHAKELHSKLREAKSKSQSQ